MVAYNSKVKQNVFAVHALIPPVVARRADRDTLTRGDECCTALSPQQPLNLII